MTQNNTKKSNLLVLGDGNEAQMLIEALNKVNPESRANIFVLSPTNTLPEIELVRHTLDIHDSTPIVCPLDESDLLHHPKNHDVVTLGFGRSTRLGFGRRITLRLLSSLSAPETIPHIINDQTLITGNALRPSPKIKTLKKVKVPEHKKFKRRSPTKRGK